MTLGELVGQLMRLPYRPDALVVVRGENYVLPHSIKSVELEHHDDGDGSTTVWLTVEEM